MGINIVNTLEGTFIGTVKAYDLTTREVAVFIPKLMPAIAENQKDISIMTNFGNSNLNNINYSPKVTNSSYIWVKADDMDESIPKIDSKVSIYFLEDNPSMGYWSKFNPNGDYDVIDEEKYSKILNLTISDKSNDIYTDDEIDIELPQGYSIAFLENEKKKKFKVIDDNDILGTIKKIEDEIGWNSYILFDDNGVQKIIDGKGIKEQLFELEKKVNQSKYQHNILLKNDSLCISFQVISTREQEYDIHSIQSDFENIKLVANGAYSNNFYPVSLVEFTNNSIKIIYGLSSEVEISFDEIELIDNII